MNGIGGRAGLKRIGGGDASRFRRCVGRRLRYDRGQAFRRRAWIGFGAVKHDAEPASRS